MSTSAQMDQVVATVMSIVQAEYERFQKFPAVNLHAPLFYNFCSDICWKIKKALRRLGIDSEVVRGLWVGPVSDHYRATFDSDPATDKKRRYSHEWLKIRVGDEELLVDPTYLQFMPDGALSFDAFRRAAQYCQAA